MSFFNRLMYREDSEPEKKVANAPMNEAEKAPMPHADDLPLSDHEIAAQLPPETSVVRENGFMDSHRKPIVSINGKDITDHDENREPAA